MLLSDEGKCTVHDTKPTEGKLAIHDGHPDQITDEPSVHEMVAQTWDSDEGRRIVKRWEAETGNV